MTDWLDDYEAKFKAQQGDKRTADQLQLHKAQVLKEKARGVLDSITAQATALVDRYREKFTDVPERAVTYTVKPSGGFKLDKAYYPSASVDVSLNGDRIEALYSYVLDRQAQPRTQVMNLALFVDVNNEIEVKTPDRALTSHQDIATYLIQRVLTA